jgi:hypothetical protein
MTIFTIKPIKEVMVSELIQESLENFLYTCKIVGVHNAIWAQGMIILVMPAKATDKIAERQLNGSRFYELVVFVKFPKYAKSVAWNGGTFELPLRDYTNYPRFCEFADWVKQQPEWKEKMEKSK